MKNIYTAVLKYFVNLHLCQLFLLKNQGNKEKYLISKVFLNENGFVLISSISPLIPVHSLTRSVFRVASKQKKPSFNYRKCICNLENHTYVRELFVLGHFSF